MLVKSNRAAVKENKSTMVVSKTIEMATATAKEPFE
jgi:hypothetical protein